MSSEFLSLLAVAKEQVKQSHAQPILAVWAVWRWPDELEGIRDFIEEVDDVLGSEGDLLDLLVRIPQAFDKLEHHFSNRDAVLDLEAHISPTDILRFKWRFICERS